MLSLYTTYKDKESVFLLLMLLVCCISSSAAAEGENSPQELPLLATAKTYGSLPGPQEPFASIQTALSEQRFTANPLLYSPEPARKSSQADTIEEWRDFVFGRLERHRKPEEPGAADTGGIRSNDQLNEQAAYHSRVRRAIMKETFNYARSKTPLIDAVVRYSKVEVSHNMERDTPQGPAQDRNKATGQLTPQRKKNEGFSFKAGMKIDVDSGGVVPVAEARAGYSSVTSFYKLPLNGRGQVMGLEYPVAANARVQLKHERNVSRATGPAGMVTQETTNWNLLQLTLAF